MSMNTRQEKLFKSIIEEHIKTAEPVGSNLLVLKHFKNISSATVRSEMSELEEQGLITQPHTSAGRIPTEAGYRFYVNNFVKNDLQAVRELKRVRGAKDIAKKIAEISGQAVIVSFSKDNVYYTGISNVFSQPEFREYDLVYNFTSIIDHLDEVIAQIYDRVKSEVEVKIGSENPFGADCGLVIAKNNKKMLGIVGPMRMDYQKNINLLRYAKTLI